MEFTGDLRGQDFSGRDMTGALFHDADLYRATFTGANLEDAFFLNCFAAEATFERARGARLQAAHSNFYRACFRGADLTEATFHQCVLACADLRAATLLRLTLTLDCNTFEEVQIDRAAAAELAYLFGRLHSPHRRHWLDILGPRDRAWLDRVFAR